MQAYFNELLLVGNAPGSVCLFQQAQLSTHIDLEPAFVCLGMRVLKGSSVLNSALAHADGRYSGCCQRIGIDAR